MFNQKESDIDKCRTYKIEMMVPRDFVSKVEFYSHLIEATATDRVVVRVDHLVSPDLTTQRLISPFVCCFTDKRIWAEIRTKPVSAYLAQTTRIHIGNIPHVIKRILCHLESLPQPTFILAFPCANSLNVCKNPFCERAGFQC